MTAKRLPAALKPRGLGPRGSALYKLYSGLNPADIGRILLLTEACRLTDRLDRLDAILSGDVDVWARVQLPKNESVLVLRIDSAAVEARQSANSLRQIVAQLGPPPGMEGAEAGGSVSSPAEQGRAIVESIVGRHASPRRSDAQSA